MAFADCILWFYIANCVTPKNELWNNDIFSISSLFALLPIPNVKLIFYGWKNKSWSNFFYDFNDFFIPISVLYQSKNSARSRQRRWEKWESWRAIKVMKLKKLQLLYWWCCRRFRHQWRPHHTTEVRKEQQVHRRREGEQAKKKRREKKSFVS